MLGFDDSPPHRTTSRVIPRFTSTKESVLIDTVIRNTILAAASSFDDDRDDESYCGDESLETSSDSDSDYSASELQDELKQLEISFDNNFLDYDDKMHLRIQCILKWT